MGLGSLSRPDVVTEICSKMKSLRFLSFLCLLIFVHIVYGAEKVEEKPLEEPNLSRESDATGTNEAKSETPTASTDENTSDDDRKYALGSLCNYCSYCKFCELCDKDCPCTKSKTKPNCHLCKYCKYCSLCNVCDTVCTPGGIVDIVSSAIYNSLPSFDKEAKESVDKDIESARKWIKEYL